MARRKILTIALMLAFTAAGLTPSRSEPDTRAKAQVFTRQTPGGARLTFSWDSREAVPFTITRSANQVVLHFEEPVTLRWGSAIKAVRPYIESVETMNGGDTVVLTLEKPSKAQFLEFDGPRDIENDKNGVDLAAIRGASRAYSPAPEDAEPILEEPIPQATIPPRRHAKKRHERKQGSPLKSVETADARTFAALAPAAGGPPSPVAAAPAPSGIPLAPKQPDAASPAAEPSVLEAKPSTPAQETMPSAAKNTVIALPFKPNEPFAAFVWQNRLWIIADKNSSLVEGDLHNTMGPVVQDVRSLPDPHAAIFYMPLASDVSAAAEKTPEGIVRIVLSEGPASPSGNSTPTLGASSSGQASVVLPAGKAARAYSFLNPVTGDRLTVIPTPETGAGMAPARTFAEFGLLQTAQGIVVRTLSDNVSVMVEKGNVVIAGEGGLALSPEAKQQMQETQSEAMASRLPPILFPYARWRLEDEKNFVPAQVQLLHDIVFGPQQDADKNRLKLLGLYLSEGLFPEALAMSDDILRSSLKFYQEHKISALRGAAYLFMYRVQEAERDFSVPELKDDPEAQMLNRLCRELLGEETEPFDFSSHYDRFISHYPPSFIQKLGIIGADRTINRKNYAAATGIFDTLKRDGYDEPVRKYIDYMRAKILSETHEETEAAKIWEGQAGDLDDPLIRARAEFSLVNMQLKSDKITHDEAARRLEQVRIVWRGDALEVNILHLLGTLYAQDKHYDKALRTMRDIVLYYPDIPEALLTAREMEKIFVALYNNGAADSMAPLDALALFYEFRDLVPLGRDGDRMIRNLADRLVSLDLLDRAALLLDHQIRNRLEGAERSRVAAQLAHIYLLNHQPQQALDALKTTGYGDLPDDVQLERIRLTARALADQGLADKAIDVLSPDASAEGTALRLSIYWDNKAWTNVISIAEDMLGNRADPSVPLNVPESEVLLKLATAYVYEHDTGQLQYLKDYFTPLMKNNPNRDNFLFITSESGPVDYDSLAGLDRDMGEVKSYLSKTHDTPGKDGFSKALN